MRPLQAKIEPVYVVPGSDAEAHVRKRHPHKTIRHVHKSDTSAERHGLPSGIAPLFSAASGREFRRRLPFYFHGYRINRSDGNHSRRHHQSRDQSYRNLYPARRRRQPNLVAISRERKESALGFAHPKNTTARNPRWLLKFSRCFPS